MDIFNVLNMVGGLSLFLYGMNAMGNGLSKMAGGKLESILERLTSKRMFAVLLGAGVTAIIQSSSATTVMIVGFVNSGIMQLRQAVGIIMGANIGTTITSWMLSMTGIQGDVLWLKLLKPSSFSPILAAIGILLIMVSKEETKKKDIGNILIGFAILMFGMETMSGAVSGLAGNETFTGFMTTFSNPVLGMAVGALLTAIIQSSSASVGILQALCITGVIPYAVVIPIIMGQNIGTCITSILSSIGANRNAKRAAMIHLYFNMIGTALFMIIFYTMNQFVVFPFLEKSANAAGVAAIHSLFNIGATIVLFPFANLLVRLAEVTIRDRIHEVSDDVSVKRVNIDERFLERPAFAMELCRNKVIEMAKVTEQSLHLCLEMLKNYDEAKFTQVVEMEDLVDDYEDALGTYLVKLSSKNISAKDSQTLSIILHSISDLERISDHARDIAKSANEMYVKGLRFSEDAQNEIDVLCQAVNDILSETMNAFCNDNLLLATKVEPLEEVVDVLTKKIKEKHISRLQSGKCTIEMGFILEDILTDLERVSDHCSNIAVEMLTIYENGYNTHEYFETLSEKERDSFNTEFEILIQKYQFAEK